MKTTDLHLDSGEVFGFEIRNCGRTFAGEVVMAVPGVRVLELHHSYWGPDEFCRFEPSGERFTVWEPFGDSSHYWVAPDNEKEPAPSAPLLDPVQQAFAAERERLRPGALITLLLWSVCAVMLVGAAQEYLPKTCTDVGVWFWFAGAVQFPVAQFIRRRRLDQRIADRLARA